MTANPVTLLLVPTKTELQHLTRQPGFALHSPCELCGFGPVSAAARTSSLITKYHPDRVILTGIAGTFDHVTLPIGTAATFPRVVMHGIGVGSGAEFTPAGVAGFWQWDERRDRRRTSPGDSGNACVRVSAHLLLRV